MQRPTSITVFGVLNIIFGGLGLVSLLSVAALFSASASDVVSANPVVEIMRKSPEFAAWMKFSVPLGALASVVAVAAGIGLLKFKEWGRKLSLGYGIYGIVAGIAGIVVNYLFLLHPMLEMAKQKEGPEAAGAMGGAIGGSIGGCFGLIYPVLLLIFMTRPEIVRAFRAATPPSLPSVG